MLSMRGYLCGGAQSGSLRPGIHVQAAQMAILDTLLSIEEKLDRLADNKPGKDEGTFALTAPARTGSPVWTISWAWPPLRASSSRQRSRQRVNNLQLLSASELPLMPGGAFPVGAVCHRRGEDGLAFPVGVTHGLVAGRQGLLRGRLS
jgi:hypothetical protein